MLAFTLILLLPQAGAAPNSDVIGSLPVPLAALEIVAPQQLFGALLDSQFQHKFLESSIWATLTELPQYPMALVAWQTFLAPAQGHPAEFLAALAGDGALLLVTPGAGPGEFDFSLLTSGNDGELAQDCLLPLLGFAGIPRSAMAGESWQVTIDKFSLGRSEDRFAFGTNAALLQRYLEIPFAQLLAAAVPADCRSTAAERGGQAVLWVSADLYRTNDYPELPKDAGASYLLGDIHEVLRTAPWMGGSLRAATGEIALDFFAPTSAELPATHAPFFPAPYEVPMPLLSNLVLQGVFTRDLGVWWTARELYMQDRAVAATVEGDATLALLFGRDPGPEIFAWLESDIRLLASVLPESARLDLPIEYPGGAIGLRLKEDAPKDLADAFASAFLAGVTIANLDGGGKGKQPLMLNIEQTEQGSIYSASFRSAAPGQALAARHNLSPSLFLGKDGAIWISSSLALLQEIAAAPVQMVAAHGLWFDLQMPQLLEILERDRNILVANRLLKEGGDIEAARSFIDMLMSGLAILNRASIRSRLDGGLMSMQVEIHAAP
jgi:hypothetical protein